MTGPMRALSATAIILPAASGIPLVRLAGLVTPNTLSILRHEAAAHLNGMRGYVVDYRRAALAMTYGELTSIVCRTDSLARLPSAIVVHPRDLPSALRDHAAPACRQGVIRFASSCSDAALVWVADQVRRAGA